MITIFESIECIKENTNEIVTTEEIKDFIKISSNSEDKKILQLSHSARKFAENFCNISIVPQNYSVLYSQQYIKYDKIIFPISPVNSVEKVEYIWENCTYKLVNEKLYCFNNDTQVLHLKLNNYFDLMKIIFSTKPDIQKIENLKLLLLQHIKFLYEEQILGKVCNEKSTLNKIQDLYSPYRILRI